MRSKGTMGLVVVILGTRCGSLAAQPGSGGYCQAERSR